MTVSTVAQDRTVKLPIPEGVIGVEDTEGNGQGGAALFSELMAQLVIGEGQDGETAGDGKTASDDTAPLPEQPAAATATTVQISAPLQALLANAMSAITQDVKAEAQAVASVEANSGSDVLKLAQLIAQSITTKDAAGADVSADAGVEMKGVDAVLEAWAEGPYAVAAPGTGAKDKRPMDMAVVNVETHFAPVVNADADADASAAVAAVMKGDALAMPPELKRDSSADVKVDAKIAGVIAAAANVKAETGAQSGAGDNGRDKPARDERVKTAASTETAAGHVEGRATADVVAQPAQPVSAAKQIVNEVVRTVQAGFQPVSVHALDGKSGLSKLKVLHLQLQPENLGMVTVRLSLRDDTLQLHIDASKPETAELIQRDREVLTSLLRGVGYTAEEAQIRVTHADPSITATMSSNGDSSLGSSQSNTFSQSNSQSAGERAAQEREGNSARRDRGEQGGQGSAEREAAASRRSEASGVYL